MRLSKYVCLGTLAVVWCTGSASAGTLTVCASGCAYTDLQLAINAAQPGDTILLRAGETFTGHYVLPVKTNTTGAFITIRSDAPDSSLPSASTRLIPPGRSGANVQQSALARLRGKGDRSTNTPVLQTNPGAHHYRFQFLDVDGIGQEGWGTLVGVGTAGAAQSTLSAVPYTIEFDRVYIHGHPVKGQKRCLALNGRDVTVRNSYISDCASFSSDSQAVGGWNGPGPFKIINNYLEGSGENIYFGGGDPSIPNLVPSDIEIRSNHVSKPLAWRDPLLRPPASSPGAAALAGSGALAAGTHYFKLVALLDSQAEVAVSTPSPERSVAVSTSSSAVRLTWSAVARADRYRIYRGTSSGGQNRYMETPPGATTFTYTGTGELSGTPPSAGTKWTVKNLLELKNAQRVTIDGNLFEHNWLAGQTGYAILLKSWNQDGTAPWSVVRDVTFTRNVVRHVASGINLLGYGNGYPTQQMRNVTIANNLFYDVDGSRWGGDGHFLIFGNTPANVTVDHNTILHGGMVVSPYGNPTYGFRFTNNLARHNLYGIKGDSRASGTATLSTYVPDAVVQRNVLAGGNASQYPPGNLFPAVSEFMAQFVSAASDDYRLVSGSSYRGGGTDGRDLGADFASLSAAFAAVGGSTSGGGSPPPPPPPPPGGTTPAPDIVLYASDATRLAGNWTRAADSSGAGGQKLQSADRGWSTADVPRAAPADYVEAQFTPQANRDYRLWLRLRATGDSKWNESVWVQFSGAVDGSGRPVWPIGSTSALLVNLERCSACGVSGWGWQNRAYWKSDNPVVRFATASTQTIRIQTREDGVAIDQIVLSPVTYFSSAPGTATRDATIVAKGSTGGGTTDPPIAGDVVLYSAQVIRTAGNWSRVSDASAAGGQQMSSADRGWSTTSVPLAAPADYFEVSFTAEANREYRLWLRLKATGNSKWNESVWVQFSGATDRNGTAKWRIGSTSALLVNLEDCSACGVSGWGWQDNAYWVSDSSIVKFPTGGTQTLRIQTREDGVTIDQIVLSPGTYLASAPGPVKNDGTIVPR
jgi:hypothetical protein